MGKSSYISVASYISTDWRPFLNPRECLRVEVDGLLALGAPHPGSKVSLLVDQEKIRQMSFAWPNGLFELQLKQHLPDL